MHKLVALLAALAIPFAIAGCGSSDATSGIQGGTTAEAQAETKAPASLNGTWTAEGLEAVIADNSIEINIVGDNTRSLYWKGTFPAGDESVKSMADAEALSSSMLGSQDEKVFTVKEDQIDFEMSIAGTTKTVHLEK